MRKVLSFVLVLSLVLGSFSMAFAADTTAPTSLSDIAGVKNEEAIQVAFDLGIVTGNTDGTFLPEKSVNRAEFAAMITRALAIPESALAGYTNTKFKDMSGYGWATSYIAFCESKGIMLGDGSGNVMPGRAVNTNEAMTMVLRAVGYTANSDRLTGVWPANYVTLAQNNNLYDDVATSVTVNKASAAQIIYNALPINKAAVATDGKTEILTTSLLTSGLGCTMDPARVLLGDEDTKINLKPYVGAYAVTFTKTVDKEIVAIGEVKSTSLSGDYDAAKGILEVGDVEYKVSSNTAIEGFGYKLDNAKATKATNPAIDMESFDDKSIVVAADVSGKTINKVYSVSNWTVDKADKASATVQEDIADNELNGSDFTENDDKKIDTNSFELVGVSNLSKIAKDNVVYVYEEGSNGDIVKVAVGTEIVTGKVTDVDGTEFVINGKTYETASDAGINAAPAKSAPAAGKTVKAFLDAYGNVYDWEADKSAADSFGIVKGYEAGGVRDESVRLYTSADATKTFAIDEDTTPIGNGVDYKISGNLIGYSLDKNGAIDTIDQNVVSGSAAYLQSAKVLNLGNKTYPIADNCVVFTITGSDYGVTTIAKVDTGVKNPIQPANVPFQAITDADGYVVAMTVNKDVASKSSTDTYGVFNKTTTSVDADDKDVQRLVGFANGTEFDKNSSKKNVITLDRTKIELYKIDLDSDGLVTKTSECAVDTTVNGKVTISDINSDKTAINVGGKWYSLADKVAVYKAELKDGKYEYSKSSASTLRESYKVSLFEVDDDIDGYEVVIFEK